MLEGGLYLGFAEYNVISSAERYVISAGGNDKRRVIFFCITKNSIFNKALKFLKRRFSKENFFYINNY